MEIKGQITMLIGEDGMHIEIHDKTSSVCFLRANISAKEMCQAFGRLAQTSMEKCDIYNLDKVGKKMEMDTLEFVLGNPSYEARKGFAIAKAKALCPEGWEADCYFGSQTSFFRKGNEEWARTTIRRWV